MNAWVNNCSQASSLYPSANLISFERRARVVTTRHSYHQRRPADGWKRYAGGSYRKPFSAFNRNNHYTSGTTQWGPLQSVIPFSQEAVLILVPVVIVGIPWLVEHWQLAAIVTAVVYLGPFGSVLTGFLQPKKAGLSQPFWDEQDQDPRLFKPIIDVEVMPDEEPSTTFASRQGSEQIPQREIPLSSSDSQGFVKRTQPAPVRRRVYTRRTAVIRQEPLQQAPVQRRDETDSGGVGEHYWRIRKQRKSFWAAILSRLPIIRRWGGFL